MCGIVGIIQKDRPVDVSKLKTMCDSLQSRGPDAGDLWVNDTIGLGHRRLSIIDLKTGDQPMTTPDKSLIIVYNGEVYNFKEIREELIKKGYSFITTSDTEVLLKGYQHFGMDELLLRLEGMFAFALYDKLKEEVFIVRDKFGEKPLYYSNENNSLRFASELKALKSKFTKKDIDKRGLNFFLSLTYIPAPYTIYQGIKKLKPGNYIHIKKNQAPKFYEYYNLQKQLTNYIPETNFENSSRKLKDLLSDSIKKRMVSDVPIGAFLSGGIDSSIVSSLMANHSEMPINTFSIGFNEKAYDESERAQIIANKIRSNHKTHFLDYKDVVELVDEIVLYFDEPFGDSSALPSYYVAKLARESVKVVLTGDAADEIFGGYEKYLSQYYISKFKKLPKFLQKIFKNFIYVVPHTKVTNSLLRKIKKVLNNAERSEFDVHYNMMCLGFNDIERNALLNTELFEENIINEVNETYESFNSSSAIEKGFYTDLKYVLEGDMLTKVDRVCMMNSLEARVPFLDSKIVEFAFNLPLSYKIKGRNKKYILKETFRNLLPPATVNFRKKGFGVPVDTWFKNELRTEISSLLSKEFINKQGIFNYQTVKKILDEHLEEKENHKGKLWNLYVFQKWYLNKIS